MSVKLMGAVIDCGPQDRTQFCVMMTLANNADDFGFAFPSLATIAENSRCDLRTAMRQVAELEARGWIFVARKVLNGKSNVYMLNTSRLGVTAPPDARRSPLFMRLLKAYPVAMSPIFAPENSSDTTPISGDNPQPTQVTSPGTQVTKTGGSSDTACHPNRQNRQGPTRQGTVNEVEPSPPTPDGGRSKVTVEDPELQAKYTEMWNRMRTSLKVDFNSMPKHPNFREIRQGVSDWELCFEQWWLARILIVAGVWTFVTEAGDEAATEAGIAKYEARLRARVELYFGVPKDARVLFLVQEQQPLQEAV